MEFIVNRFLNALERDYGFCYEVKARNENVISVRIGDNKMPQGLKSNLSKATISVFDEYMEFGQMIIAKHKDRRICCNVIEGEDTAIWVIFTRDLYPLQVNALDSTIRAYYDAHSIIDQMNHNLTV